MNRLCTIEKGVKENSLRILDRRQIRMEETIHVLSVGPIDRGSMVHDSLLDGPSFRLTIATDYQKLWGLPTQESLEVAILYNTLSEFELEAACRLIRRRWPHARILIVRSGEGSLDDALYDGRVAPTVTEEVLLTTVERLTGEWGVGRRRGLTGYIDR